MNKLIATLTRFSFLFQNPVYGADRAEILALIQQGGLHGGRRAVLETLFMKDSQLVGAFLRTESPSGKWPLPGGHRLGRLFGRSESRPLPIEGSTGHPEDLTGGEDAYRGGQFGDGVHQRFSSGSTCGRHRR